MLSRAFMLLQNLHASEHCNADGAHDKNEYENQKKNFRFLNLPFRSANWQGENVTCSNVQIEAKQFLRGKTWHAHNAIMMLPT